MCSLGLHERSDWRAMDPDKHWWIPDRILCMYCNPIHTLLFGMQVRMTTKLTYTCTCTLRLHITHQMMALLPMMYRFV